MSVILLPQRFLSQPQYPAEIDHNGLGKGIQLLFNPATGPVDLATGRIWTAGGNASIAVEQKGKVFSFDGVDDYYAYTGYPEITGNIFTFFIWLPRVGPPDNYGHLYLGASSPLAYGYQVDEFSRITIGTGSIGSGTLPGWFNSTNRSLIIVSDGTAAGTKAYVDGKDTGFTWGSPPTAWGTGSKNFNIGRYVGGVNWDFDGSILSVGMTSVVWGAAEAKAFHENPWMPFKAPRRLFPVPSSGGDAVIGSVAYTNADDTSSANATPAITASSATTNADDASDAVAVAESETVTATVDVTNADDASTASAAPIVVGSSGTTNSDDASAANATATVTASAANTNADDIAAASAASGSDIEGSVAYTNIDDVSASVLTATITASVAFANSNDTSSSAGGGYTIATVAYINADDASSAFASPVVSGSLATVNADDVSEATATAEVVEVVASVAVTNANDISAAVAAPVIVGTVAYSNLHDLSAAIGVVNFGTIVETKLTTGIVEAVRVKKPGIPSTAPQWQRTMFEIMTGRRGNKIAIPPQQALTFSATPTKEECEALHSYLNDVRGSMEQLINRFDS